MTPVRCSVEEYPNGLRPAHRRDGKTLTFVTDIPSSHPRISYFRMATDRLSELSAGRLRGDVICSAEYAGRAGLESARAEKAQFAWINAAHLEAVDPQFAILNLPFFLNDDQLRAAGKPREVVRLLDQIGATRGVRVLAMMRGADQILVLRKSGVAELSQFNGARIRVAGPGIYEDIMRRLKAKPVVMPIPMVKEAFQDGRLDAIFTSPGAWSSQLGIDAPYAVFVPGLMMITYVLVASARWFESLAAAKRTAVNLAVESTVTDLWEKMEGDDEALLDDMESRGARIARAEGAEVWRLRLRPIHRTCLREHSAAYRALKDILAS